MAAPSGWASRETERDRACLARVPRQFHHREPGLAGLLGSREHGGFRRPFYSVIADGVHVHQNAIRIAYDANPKGTRDQQQAG